MLLTKTARRAFAERLQGLPERGPRYRPPALKDVRAIVHVTLREHGAALGEAESPEMAVVDAAAAAGNGLGRIALEKKLKILADRADCGLEMEILGPPEFLAAKYEEGGVWSEELLHAFEPGVEGIGVDFRGKQGWTRPSEIVSLNYTPDLALQYAESNVALTHADKLRFEKEIRYFRFRSRHLWQSSARALPVLLTRGDRLVRPDETDRTALDAAINRLGDYLLYRQNQDGWFAEEYLPSSDRYNDSNTARAQMEALDGLAAYAAWSRRPDALSEVRKGLERSSAFLTPLSVVAGVDDSGQARLDDAGLVLLFPGHEDHLRVSSALLRAIVETELERTVPLSSQPASAPSRSAQNRQERVAGLIEGILVCQDADGRLEMVFGQPRQEPAEDFAAAGLGLLALARAYQAGEAGIWARLISSQAVGSQSSAFGSRPTTAATRGASDYLAERIERAMQRALTYYCRVDRTALGPTHAAILARGFAAAYEVTGDAKASDLVFSILDRFVPLQIDERSCPWPELHGAINAKELGLIGIDTAIYTTALADGAALAERIGDRQRAEVYRKAVRSAARFVLQLEFREEGCHYVRSRRDALGGIRAAPWDNRIRVENCAEALSALMRARAVLYGSDAQSSAAVP